MKYMTETQAWDFLATAWANARFEGDKYFTKVNIWSDKNYGLCDSINSMRVIGNITFAMAKRMKTRIQLFGKKYNLSGYYWRRNTFDGYLNRKVFCQTMSMMTDHKLKVKR